jgi:hypothetical protein
MRLFIKPLCDIRGAARSVVSSLPSWRAPFRLRLWRRRSRRITASMRAAPAKLPTTLPTTCGGARGMVLPVEAAPAADDVFAAGGAGLPGAPAPAPPINVGLAAGGEAAVLLRRDGAAPSLLESAESDDDDPKEATTAAVTDASIDEEVLFDGVRETLETSGSVPVVVELDAALAGIMMNGGVALLGVMLVGVDAAADVDERVTGPVLACNGTPADP